MVGRQSHVHFRKVALAAVGRKTGWEPGKTRWGDTWWQVGITVTVRLAVPFGDEVPVFLWFPRLCFSSPLTYKLGFPALSSLALLGFSFPPPVTTVLCIADTGDLIMHRVQTTVLSCSGVRYWQEEPVLTFYYVPTVTREIEKCILLIYKKRAYWFWYLEHLH